MEAREKKDNIDVTQSHTEITDSNGSNLWSTR